MHIPINDLNKGRIFFIIVLQRYSVFVDSLYYCKYLPITKIFLDNYLGILMQIKSKISKRLFLCFPGVVDRPLNRYQ